MTGLLLVVVSALWVACCVALVRVLTGPMTSLPFRLPIAATLFLALLPAPVVDELVGGFQFRALCEKNANFSLGVPSAEGRTTRYSSNPTNELIPGTAIPIYDTGVLYTDVNSGEVVLSFHRYVAKGGVFIRALGISESNSPITMGRASCSPEQSRGETASRTMKFAVVN